MTRDERKGAESASGVEFELGGVGLVLGVAVVLALCGFSFWLGRQSVPMAARGDAAPASTSGGGEVVDGGDVEKELTFFDRLEAAPELSAQGEERTVPQPAPEDRPAEPEPEKEEAAAPSPRPAPSREPSELPRAGGGRYHVQVLATTEQEAADAMVKRLQGKGFPARVVPGTYRGETLYRVRVGGYADKDDAAVVAAAIRKREGLQTWVTP